MEIPGDHRAGIPDSRWFRCRTRSEEMRRVLPEGARVVVASFVAPVIPLPAPLLFRPLRFVSPQIRADWQFNFHIELCYYRSASRLTAGIVKRLTAGLAKKCRLAKH